MAEYGPQSWPPPAMTSNPGDWPTQGEAMLFEDATAITGSYQLDMGLIFGAALLVFLLYKAWSRHRNKR
jgi:hypothetical protein